MDNNTLLNTFMHEVNHLIKSQINSGFCDEFNYYSVRCGLSLYEVNYSNGIFIDNTTFGALDEIINVCNEYDIPLEITMLQSTPDEIIRIIEICNKKQVPVVNSMFNKTATEVEKIIDICKKHKIDVITGMYLWIEK